MRASDGSYIPSVSDKLQRFTRDGDAWSSRTLTLVELRFGDSSDARIETAVDGIVRTQRWYLERSIHPGGREIAYEYLRDGSQLYLQAIRWATMRVELQYEERPDPFSQYDAGFELRTRLRCRRIEIHHDRRAPDTLIRSLACGYEQADHTASSLLTRLDLTGHRGADTASLPPQRFTYTRFQPRAQQLRRFDWTVSPPPPLEPDTTLVDFGGTGLPGVLRLGPTGATYWENRGRLMWGPPRALRDLPSGVSLSDRGVRFADMEGRGNADLLVGAERGAGYYPNRAGQGFERKRSLRLAPSFDVTEPGSHVIDLDGDRVADLLTFRNGRPMAFFNRGEGAAWAGPSVLGDSGLERGIGADRRLRMADMTGDGTTDLVLLRSGRIAYQPYLGHGRWAGERVMEATPSFDVADPDTDVLLGDVNGDGASDLVLVGPSEIRVHLNRAGEGFSEPIVLTRTPQLGGERVLLADMTGSGSAGLLFTTAAAGRYAFLDLLGGVKAGLLSQIDNSSGLVTTIDYASSVDERARDLADGRRWSGYLPFTVPVVRRMHLHDAVSGESSTSEMRYHDGHFDSVEREYLGFAEVESTRTTGDGEAPLRQRITYHTRHATARDPALVAGRGQPHRTETIGPDGDVHVLEGSTWITTRVDGTTDDAPALLTSEARRLSQRFEQGVEYEREQVEFAIDDVGNVIDEIRTSTWTDSTGTKRTDRLRIRTDFARHTTFGTTHFEARMRKLDAAGHLLKDVRKHYDGAPFVGLPLGAISAGFRTRQSEVALTAREIDAAFDGTPPAMLTGLLREETDPEHGRLHVRDVARARVDGAGNEIEVIEAAGLVREFRFDADGLHPIETREDAGPWRPVSFDMIAQQVESYTDGNGHSMRTDYDPLGRVVATHQRGALPGRPTEMFEYVDNVVPTTRVQRVRMRHDDPEPGYEKVEYFDGMGRVAQVRIAAGARWAVGKQQRRSIAGTVIGERDAYFAASRDFDATPPPGTATRHLQYDHLGRVIGETLFNGLSTVHRYHRNEVDFFDPDASLGLAADPATLPTRRSVLDASGMVRSLFERDGVRWVEVRRDHDELRRLVRIVDPKGNDALANVYDLWGNRIRIRSADGGDTRFVFDAESREVERIDATGQSLRSTRDGRGRVTELLDGAGTVIERYHYDNGAGDNLVARLARVDGEFGTAEYSYTPAGDVARITRTFPGQPATFVTGFEFDAHRHIQRVVYPDGSAIDYRHDRQGMLSEIPGFIAAVDHGPTGLRERIEYANGLETHRRYTSGDYLLRELRTEATAGGPRYQHLVYDLDPVGQVRAITDLSSVAGKVRLNQQFTYDDRNRLVRAVGSQPGYDFEYRYDDLGNLTLNGETNTTLHYGHEDGPTPFPNRLTRRDGAAVDEYAYDDNGSLTADPEIGTLRYDQRHRLVRTDRPDGTVIAHRYDHNDRRVMTTVDVPGQAVRTRLEIEGLFIVEDGVAAKVVFDEDRRLAVIPAAGDTLLHHFDRLGNVNVMSNAATGAFVGNDEYTPYGRLFVSLVIEPAFTFQGGRFTDGLEMTLLGARWYRPALGRFLTCDPTLMIDQDRIAPLGAAVNLYVYGYCSPTNFTDPSGEIAPLLVAIIVAAIVGAIIGAIGAGVNGAKTWDEWVLWIVGGAIGGVLSVLAWYGILVWLGVSVVAAAVAATAITLGASVLGLFTPLMDESDSGVAWAFSWAIKLIKSPVFTILGLLVVAGLAIAGKRVDFRRGALFVEVGSGESGLTLGAIVYTESGHFGADGRVNDDYARHEAYHTRTVATLGEFGFYVTYVLFGSLFGGPWNALDARGCGNPFEKHAYTYYNPFSMGPNPNEVQGNNCWTGTIT